MKILMITMSLLVVVSASPMLAQTTKNKTQASEANVESKTESPAALNFNMKSLDGKNVSLGDYQGNVVVFVNVASKCGLTPQYEQLQDLHKKYEAKGLKIVGFPCNQFGGQEPGTAKEIKSFCEENYGVTFDMMAKVDVNGEKQCELYKYLNELDLQPKGKGNIKWNFEKYLIDRSGKPIARFGPRVKPDSEDFIKAIETALGQN